MGAVMAFYAAPAEARSVPKSLNLPSATTEIRSGANTLAPLAHVRFCKAYPAECRTLGPAKRVSLTPPRWKQLKMINVRINSTISPRTDQGKGAFKDQWTLSPRSGDCEDYALTKRSKLLRMGWPSSSLLIATATVPGLGGHAVLIVRTDRGDFVLDNLRNEIRSWRRTGYRWMKMQSPDNPRYWVTM